MSFLVIRHKDSILVRIWDYNRLRGVSVVSSYWVHVKQGLFGAWAILAVVIDLLLNSSRGNINVTFINSVSFRMRLHLDTCFFNFLVFFSFRVRPSVASLSPSVNHLNSAHPKALWKSHSVKERSTLVKFFYRRFLSLSLRLLLFLCFFLLKLFSHRKWLFRLLLFLGVNLNRYNLGHFFFFHIVLRWIAFWTTPITALIFSTWCK